MSPRPAIEPYTFDRLQVGELIGRRSDRIDAHSVALWHEVYGQSPGHTVPTGFAAVLVMRAYLAIVSPRPPGNIHRALKIEVHAPLAEGQPVSTAVTCITKQQRNGRRYVAFEVTVSAENGAPAVRGEIDMVWAA